MQLVVRGGMISVFPRSDLLPRVDHSAGSDEQEGAMPHLQQAQPPPSNPNLMPAPSATRFPIGRLPASYIAPTRPLPCPSRKGGIELHDPAKLQMCQEFIRGEASKRSFGKFEAADSNMSQINGVQNGTCGDQYETQAEPLQPDDGVTAPTLATATEMLTVQAKSSPFSSSERMDPMFCRVPTTATALRPTPSSPDGADVGVAEPNPTLSARDSAGSSEYSQACQCRAIPYSSAERNGACKGCVGLTANKLAAHVRDAHTREPDRLKKIIKNSHDALFLCQKCRRVHVTGHPANHSEPWCGAVLPAPMLCSAAPTQCPCCQVRCPDHDCLKAHMDREHNTSLVSLTDLPKPAQISAAAPPKNCRTTKIIEYSATTGAWMDVEVELREVDVALFYDGTNLKQFCPYCPEVTISDRSHLDRHLEKSHQLVAVTMPAPPAATKMPRRKDPTDVIDAPAVAALVDIPPTVGEYGTDDLPSCVSAEDLRGLTSDEVFILKCNPRLCLNNDFVSVDFIPKGRRHLNNYNMCQHKIFLGWRCGSATDKQLCFRLHLFFGFMVFQADTTDGGIASAVKRRLFEFLKGNYRKLINEAVMTMDDNLRRKATLNASKVPEKLDPNTVPRSKLHRAEKLAEVGRLSAAVRTVTEDTKVVIPMDGLLTKLKSKHPERRPEDELPLPPEQSEPCDQPLFTRKQFEHTIRHFPHLGAPDMCGHRYEYYDKLHGPALDEFYQFCADLVHAPEKVLLDEEMRRMFASGNIVTFDKGGTDVRPLAIGLTIRRIASRCICLAQREAFEALFRGTQFGVANKNGIEKIIHAMRELWEAQADEDWGFFQYDAVNAFNTVRRKAILDALEEKFEALVPFFLALYQPKSFLRVRQNVGFVVMLSQEGVQQGDPLGPFLFCVALSLVMDKISDIDAVLNLAYMDDITSAGPMKTIRDAIVPELEKAEQSIGLKTNRSKSIVDGRTVVPAGFNAEYKVRATRLAAKVEEQGLKVLGSPVGTGEYVDCFFDKEIKDYDKALARLVQVPDKQLAMLMFKHKVGQIDFLLRTTPSDQTLKFCEDYDRTTLKYLALLLGRASFPESTPLQIFLKLGNGGLGIYSAVGHRLPAYTASWATFLHTAPFARRGQWDTVKTLAVNKKARAPALISDMESCLAVASLPKLGDAMPLHLESKLFAAVEESNSKKFHSADPARAESLQEPTSFSAFNALPTLESTRLAAKETEYIYLSRLGLPTLGLVEHDTYCVCGALITEDHLTGCPAGGHWITRHNETNQIFHSMLTCAGFHTELEVTGELNGQQRADLIAFPSLFDSPFTKVTIFDVSVTKNSQRAAFNGKLHKYKEVCDEKNRDMVPLIFGIDGSCLPETRNWKTMLVSRISSAPDHFTPSPSAPSVSSYYDQLLSCAILRGTARQYLRLCEASVVKANRPPVR
jgi:hypothetical protein